MKCNVNPRHMVAIFIVALGLHGTVRAQPAEVVRIATEDWCPLVCTENGKVTGGYLTEAITQAMQLRGYKVEFALRLDFGAINEMKGTALQGTFVGPHDQGVKISDVVFWTRECFYTLTDSAWTYNGVESLTSVSLGISSDFTFEVPELDQHIEKNRRNHNLIDIAHGDHASSINLNKLLGKRFQVLAEDEAVMAMLLDKTKAADKVRMAGCTGKPLPIYVGFFNENPHSDDYAKALNAGMKQLAANGQLAALRQRYNVPDGSTTR